MAAPIPADAVLPRRLRRYILGALAAALVLAAGYCFGYEPPYRGALVERPPRPLIFAHRGFGDHGPDNSLYAVERALRAGMDGVDLDGQLTRDSELVVFHDLSVDRLTAGAGRVRDKTRDEMLALDLGPKYDPAIHGAYVRALEQSVVLLEDEVSDWRLRHAIAVDERNRAEWRVGDLENALDAVSMAVRRMGLEG